MGKMTGTCWVTTTNGTLLEVALQDVTAGEGVSAKHTHVWTISGVCSGLELAQLGNTIKTYV